MDQALSEQSEKVAGAPTQSAAVPSQSVTDEVSKVATEQPPAVQALPPEPAGDAAGDGAAAILEEREKAQKLKAEVEELRQLLEKAQVSASEKSELSERVEALAAQVVLQKSAARLRVLDSMGVKEHLKKYAPEVDVDTPEGMTELQTWAESHPEFVSSSRSEDGPAFSPDQLTKKFNSPHLVNIEMLKGRKP